MELSFHEEKAADITMSLMEADRNLAYQFGVAEVDSDFRILGFQEKPRENPKTIPGDPSHVLASMGIYLFRTEALIKMLKSSTEDDFGSQIIPKSLDSYRIYAYPYRHYNCIEDYIYETLEDGERQLQLEPCTRDSAYWRDVGTLDAYWNPNMDLTGVDPYFSPYPMKASEGGFSSTFLAFFFKLENFPSISFF